MATKEQPTAIDLFSGAGGLTLGLKKAGFRVVAGVEYDENVCRTYNANHPEVRLLNEDAAGVTGKQLLELAGVDEVDLVAGCPPCQGFSKLTDKYHREDPRNALVLEMSRLVEEIEPQMVMMENVPGLAIRGTPLLEEFCKTLENAGYIVRKKVLQLANYGVPQSRRRLVVLAGKGFAIEMPEPTHSRTGDDGKRPWLTLRHALRYSRNLGKPVKFQTARKRGGPQEFDWHVVSDLDDISIQRYRALGAGRSRETLPEHLRPDCHKGEGIGFENVYGRMRWTQVPVTITGGCTTPCKGRFGHPQALRTISVREAALIQTFPLRYKFDTEYKDFVCSMIGNALPPKFAQIAARQCLQASARSGA